MRKALIAVGALALALTVGACGDEKTGTPLGGGKGTAEVPNTGGGLFNDAQSLVDAAKEGTAKAKTSKFTMDMNMGSMVSMKAEGQAEYAGADTKMAMTMNMDMSGVPGAGGGQAGGMTIEMIMIDRKIYMKMPAGMGGDQAKPWMAMSLDDLSSGGAGMGQSFEMSDPSKTLEMIQENGKILNTSQTTIDGQPATTYEVELDFKKLAEKMGQTLPGDIKIDNIPMKVSLNSDNLPVQIEMDMGAMMKQIGEQTGQTMPGMEDAKMIAKYTNWGEPVSIQAPPPDQVNEGGIPGMPTPSTPN